MKKLLLSALTVTLLASCSFLPEGDADTSYPLEPDDMRRLERGRLTGDGITLFGGDDRASQAAANTGVGGGVAVNRYLWQATLDTISFMPLGSTDPFGGVIITEWYEAPENPGERFKLHVLIKDKRLRSDALSVNIFKQQYDSDSRQWRDVASDKSLNREFENIILTRAREIRVKETR